MYTDISSTHAQRDGNFWSFGVTLERAGAVPLDKWSYWPSLSAAEAYANDKSETNVAYPGQLLTVADTELSTVAAYIIEADGSLTKLASGGSTDDLISKLAVTIEKSEVSGNILQSYAIKQGGVKVDTIDIPKDFLVKSASVKTSTAETSSETGIAVGHKYIDFVINSKDADLSADGEHVRVDLNDLVDVYTAANNCATINVAVTDSNEISAEVKDGAITAAKLASDVSAEISAATADVDELSAKVSNKICLNGETVETLSVQNISRDDYHELVAAGKALSNTVYIVSSDTLNMYGEKIENLLSGEADGDAVNVAQLKAAKADLESAIIKSQISSASFNGASATVSNGNIAFNIDCINGGDAEVLDSEE